MNSGLRWYTAVANDVIIVYQYVIAMQIDQINTTNRKSADAYSGAGTYKLLQLVDRVPVELTNINL